MRLSPSSPGDRGDLRSGAAHASPPRAPPEYAAPAGAVSRTDTARDDAGDYGAPAVASRPGPRAPMCRPGRLVEGVATRARAGGVGVVDREALLFDAVDEVDGGPGEVGHAH